MSNPAFLALLPKEDITEVAIGGLKDLVPQALQLLNEAMSGEVPATRARVALDLVKAAAGLKQGGEDSGAPTLADKLMEMDGGARSD